jgi:pilus assembly protein Flp/PilA
MFLGAYLVAAWRRLRGQLRLGDDRGATAVEYAIMLALIAAVIVLAVTFLGEATNTGFESVEFP